MLELTTVGAQSADVAMLKASVVGVLTFFVIGVAFKYIVILPKVLKLKGASDHPKLAMVTPILSSIILMAAWATNTLDEPDPLFPEAAVITSLLSVVMLMLSAFQIVDARDVYVFVSTPSIIALHAAVFQFRHHRRWESVAVAAALSVAGGIGIAGVGRAIIVSNKA